MTTTALLARAFAALRDLTRAKANLDALLAVVRGDLNRRSLCRLP